MLIKESFLLALSSIRMNKMRSFLTMLGIIIGIGSVIGISSIGTTIKTSFKKEFEGIGLNNIDIYIDWSIENPDDFAYFNEEEDIPALRQKFGDKISYIPPSRGGDLSEIKINGKNYSLNLSGVDVGFLSTNPNMVMLKGRMINEEDIRKEKDVIVIDKGFAMEVAGTMDVIGQKIGVTVDGTVREMTIVGIYEVKVSAFARQMGEGSSKKNKTTFIPYTLFRTGGGFTNYINLYLNKNYDSKKVIEEISKFLHQMKNQKEGTYRIVSLEEQANEINKILEMLSLGIGAIAAISLLVGGIGIMNIMLVSVTERTREIGIRKALGARTGNILFQFLIESSILSLIGGMIGIVLGIGIGRIGAHFVKADLVVDPMAVVAAVVFSSLVGLFFGLYPARKAAKLDPIEALRYE